MKINCSCCKEKMKKKGAIFLSSPLKAWSEAIRDIVVKYHICVKCEVLIFEYIQNKNLKRYEN